jgi:hypothetical protein
MALFCTISLYVYSKDYVFHLILSKTSIDVVQVLFSSILLSSKDSALQFYDLDAFFSNFVVLDWNFSVASLPFKFAHVMNNSLDLSIITV